MKFSERFKRIWWLVSFIVALILMILSWDAILSSNATSFDLGLLAVVTALAVVPLFSEFTFLGLTVKQQVEEAKKEIRQDIKEHTLALRTELQNVINVRNQVAPQFFLNNPPSDELLNPSDR